VYGCMGVWECEPPNPNAQCLRDGVKSVQAGLSRRTIR
jgi:hypothetical protein